MKIDETNPFFFACLACDIVGYDLPDRSLPEGHAGGFRMTFLAATGVDLAITHEPEHRRFVVTATFEPPKRRSREEVAVMALSVNHLRLESELCFAMDPTTKDLNVSQSVSDADLDLTDLAKALADLSKFAMNWRRLMDEPAGDEALDLSAMIRV